MEYESNSKKTKIDEKPKQEAVAKGVKQPPKNNFLKNFIKDDLSSISKYIVSDVVVPAIRKAIYDTLSGGIDALFYGADSKPTKSGSNVSYQKYYKEDNYKSNNQAQHYNPDTILINTRNEAEDVLLRMQELISSYGIVSIADFYELVDVTGKYTDYKYGWTNIDSATVSREPNGYVIKLPKARPI